MTHKQAVRLAVRAMERWIADLNVDANLHEEWGMDTPAGRNASKKRKQLGEAIGVLSQAEQVSFL